MLQPPSMRFTRKLCSRQALIPDLIRGHCRLECGIGINELENTLLDGEVEGMAMDGCDLCSGELEPGATTLEIWHGEEPLVAKDVPADVCQQCHEAYLSPEISERLDRFLIEHHRHCPERYIPLPQNSAAQAIGG